MRIMYVEDNMVNLALVERIARMGGHTVVSYTDGEKALDALATDAAHLILMDIELDGELDGIQVVQKLRERGEKRPIVAVTAYAMTGDKERILAAGCDAYLPKPVPIADLIEIIAKYDPENEQPDPEQVKLEEDAPTPLSIALRLSETGPLRTLAEATESKPPSETPKSKIPTAPSSNASQSGLRQKMTNAESATSSPAPDAPRPAQEKSTSKQSPSVTEAASTKPIMQQQQPQENKNPVDTPKKSDDTSKEAYNNAEKP